MSVGSIEGAGDIVLGSNALTTGSNLNTEVDGVISGDGGSLIKVGTGTLTLSGFNTYSGGTLLNGGTLDLAALGAAGAGRITFGDPGSEILQIQNAALSPLSSTLNSFGNQIQDIGVGDIIDLTGLTFATNAKVSYDPSTDILSVTSGGITDTLTLTNPGLTSLTGFAATSDGASGTKIELVLLPTVVADQAGVNVGASVSGNILANDNDPIAGDTLHVSAVNGQPPVNDTFVVAGTYGSLTVNADNGSYTYSAPSSDVLPSSGVAEDVFTYTAITGQGGTASSTLTVVVTAANLGTYIAVPAGGSATQSNGGHSEVLDGTAGSATLTAASGKGAVLIGGPGDILTGATSGKDIFVFTGDFGQNTINNYVGKENGNFDVIQLDESEFGTSAAALVNDAHQLGANVVITNPLNSADTITLIGVQLSSLHFDASHFLLV